MSSPNEISSLAKIMVKPLQWGLMKHEDGDYTLTFTYVDPSRKEYAIVQTRRGETKFYKTADAALRDIRRVQQQASIIYIDAN